MNQTTIGLLEAVAKDVAIAELPTVIKYVKTLEAKVPAVGFRHLALQEVATILQDIDNDLNPPAEAPAA